jgi:hypothetical protein
MVVIQLTVVAVARPPLEHPQLQATPTFESRGA